MLKIVNKFLIKRIVKGIDLNKNRFNQQKLFTLHMQLMKTNISIDNSLDFLKLGINKENYFLYVNQIYMRYIEKTYIKVYISFCHMI